MKKVFNSNNMHYTVIQIYFTREIVAKRLHLITWTKFDLVKLHNQINHSSLYHFLGLTFNSCLLDLEPICVHGHRTHSAMPPIESVLVCREAIHIRVQGLSNHYTLHCETRSVVQVAWRWYTLCCLDSSVVAFGCLQLTLDYLNLHWFAHAELAWHGIFWPFCSGCLCCPS